MAELLLLWSTLSGLLDDVDVDALLDHRREEITALEVHVDGYGFAFDSCDPGAPRVIMVRLDRDAITIGEEASDPLTVTTLDAMRLQLELLKDRRKERESVVIDVADGVTWQGVIAVVDIATATELRQITVLASPKVTALDPASWKPPRFPPPVW